MNEDPEGARVISALMLAGPKGLPVGYLSERLQPDGDLVLVGLQVRSRDGLGKIIFDSV